MLLGQMNVKMVESSNHVIFETVDTFLADLEWLRSFLDKRLLLERSKRLC